MKNKRVEKNLFIAFILCSIVLSLLPGNKAYAYNSQDESVFDGLFMYTISSDGTAVVTGIADEYLLSSYYKRKSSTIIIPSSIKGYPVKKIEENAFENVDFGTCDIIISEGIETLGSMAFLDSRAKSFMIPASVKEFTGSEYFEYVFSYVNGCEAINVDPGNSFLTSVDGVLFSKDKTVLYNYPAAKNGSSYTAPEETYYLACTSFGNCKNLKRVILPNSNRQVKFMTYTFYGCNLTLYGSQESYDKWKNDEKDYYKAGEIRYSIMGSEPEEIAATGIKLDTMQLSMKPSETGKLIAEVLPADASDKTITWESSDSTVATVDSNGLVTARSSGTAIITATAAGCNCSASCVVTVVADTTQQAKPVTTTDNSRIIRDNDDTPVEDNIQVIYDILGDGSAEITGLVDPYNNRLVIPEQVPGIWAETADVYFIKEKAFKGNCCLTSVSGGKRLYFIQKAAFRGAKYLREVDLSEARYLYSIGNNAFRNCRSLRSLTINGNNLETVGKNAFRGVNKGATVTVILDEYGWYKEQMIRDMFVRSGLSRSQISVISE